MTLEQALYRLTSIPFGSDNGCPESYPALDGHYLKRCGDCNDCKECWNQEFIGDLYPANKEDSNNS